MSAKLRILGTQECDRLIVEPWAEEVGLREGASYELLATAQDLPWFEIEPKGRTLVVYVNGKHATCQLQSNGKAIASFDVPTPN